MRGAAGPRRPCRGLSLCWGQSDECDFSSRLPETRNHYRGSLPPINGMVSIYDPADSAHPGDIGLLGGAGVARRADPPPGLHQMVGRLPDNRIPSGTVMMVMRMPRMVAIMAGCAL